MIYNFYILTFILLVCTGRYYVEYARTTRFHGIVSLNCKLDLYKKKVFGIVFIILSLKCEFLLNNAICVCVLYFSVSNACDVYKIK